MYWRRLVKGVGIPGRTERGKKNILATLHETLGTVSGF
jgi:hypothetical protein